MANKKDAGNSNGTTRVVGKPFEKGKSGNPSGRPKLPKDIKEAFNALTPVAISKLEEIINSPNTKDADRLKAIDIALDRGLGKPTQAIDLEAKSLPRVIFTSEENIPE